jgi:hypothetical protein
VKSSKADSTKSPKDISWERLICDAKAQMERAKKTVTALQRSIRFFEKQRKSGARFPL